MAFFKFRKGSDEPVASAPQPESVEVLRKRARHRLIGAALLVVAGVIGFPLLFDTQPRPIAVDIPIEIPDRNKARPLVIAPPAAAPAPATSTVVESAVSASSVKPAQKSPETTLKPEEKAAAASTRPTLGAIKKDSSKNSPETRNAADAAKAQALLEGTSPDKAKPASDSRFVVQVGAFADAALAKEARTKLERAGLKTYTTVVETKDGQRTRVRVGPFVDKTEADTAASKIKTLDLPAAVLVL